MASVDLPRELLALLDDVAFAQPPPGVKSNFESPQLVGYHSLTIASATCIFFLILFSSFRFYMKLRLINRTAIDDYLFWITLPILVLVLSLHIAYFGGVHGYHAWDIKLRKVTKSGMVVIFCYQILLPITSWLVKATLIFFILNAFKPVQWLRYLCWAGLAGNLAFYMAQLAISVVSCRPKGGIDRLSFLAGFIGVKCSGVNTAVQWMSVIAAVYGLISDVYILIIPLPAVAKLKIQKKKKAGVFMIFSSGILACIASLISLVFRVRTFGTQDLSVDSIPIMSLNMVELSIGLIITCFPSTARVSRHISNKVESYRLGQSYKTSEKTHEELFQVGGRKKHTPGGLSEIDSMKTFGTTVNLEFAEAFTYKTSEQSSSFSSMVPS